MNADWTVSMVNPSRLRGKIQFRFKNTQSQPFVYFDFAANFFIDSIVYHGNRVSPLRNGDTLFIPINGQVMDSVSITYSGFARRRDFGAFTISQHSGVPVIWTMSPPYGSRDWWPSRVRLTEKLDSIDIAITCPRGNRAVSQGILTKVDTLTSTNQLRFFWKHRYPIAHYLVSLGVTNYDIIKDSVRLRTGILPIELYPYPENRQAAINLLPDLKRTLRLFDSLFIAYPFMKEKYGMAQYGYGGGMENQTISFVGNWSRDLAAHELGHQWFGNWVTCGTMKDMWLNEGLATWLEELTIEHFDGQATIRSERATRNRQILSAPAGTITVPDTIDYLRIYNGNYTYLKGGIYARILRNELSDSLFFASIKQYLNQFGKGYARSQDWLQTFNRVSGRDLSQIHNLWLNTPAIQPIFVNKMNDTTQLTPANCVKHKIALIPIRGQDTSYNLRLASSRYSPITCSDFYATPTSPTSNWIVNGDYQYPMPTQLVTSTVILEPKELFIYPNPSKGVVNVNGLTHEAVITISDLSGKLIASQICRPTQDKIEVNTIATGVYTLTISDAESKKQFRLLITR